jgi:hypothetical protein
MRTVPDESIVKIMTTSGYLSCEDPGPTRKTQNVIQVTPINGPRALRPTRCNPEQRSRKS